jgi:hypothetical protein
MLECFVQGHAPLLHESRYSIRPGTSLAPTTINGGTRSDTTEARLYTLSPLLPGNPDSDSDSELRTQVKKNIYVSVLKPWIYFRLLSGCYYKLQQTTSVRVQATTNEVRVQATLRARSVLVSVCHKRLRSRRRVRLCQIRSKLSFSSILLVVHLFLLVALLAAGSTQTKSNFSIAFHAALPPLEARLLCRRFKDASWLEVHIDLDSEVADFETSCSSASPSWVDLAANVDASTFDLDFNSSSSDSSSNHKTRIQVRVQTPSTRVFP